MLIRAEDQETIDGQLKYINTKLDYLMGSRPTAVDLSNAIRLLKVTVNIAALAGANGQERLNLDTGKGRVATSASIREAYILAAEKILEDDLTTNLAIGRYGAEYLRRQQMPVSFPVDDGDDLRYFTTSPPGTQGAPDRTYRKLSVLTHCNTGYATRFHIQFS
jgi:methylthioribose-1-phosphate isomerase